MEAERRGGADRLAVALRLARQQMDDMEAASLARASGSESSLRDQMQDMMRQQQERADTVARDAKV